MTAASLAKTQEIKIYAIGVGSNGRAPVRMTDPRTGRSAIQMRAVQIDDELLETISTQTDGQYFRATNNDGLQQIIRDIDELERTTIQEKLYREYTEYFSLFPLVGIALYWIVHSFRKECISEGGLMDLQFFEQPVDSCLLAYFGIDGVVVVS